MSKVTLIDEMEKVFDPLTGLEGTEEMTDKLTYYVVTAHMLLAWIIGHRFHCINPLRRHMSSNTAKSWPIIVLSLLYAPLP